MPSIPAGSQSRRSGIQSTSMGTSALRCEPRGVLRQLETMRSRIPSMWTCDSACRGTFGAAVRRADPSFDAASSHKLGARANGERHPRRHDDRVRSDPDAACPTTHQTAGLMVVNTSGLGSRRSVRSAPVTRSRRCGLQTRFSARCLQDSAGAGRAPAVRVARMVPGVSCAIPSPAKLPQQSAPRANASTKACASRVRYRIAAARAPSRLKHE